jgi:proteasome assembly chaperone (PAC2) family protein
MGGVAINAGYYLLAKLGMRVFAEYEARELFDVNQVEVKDGIIQPGHWPANRFFVWPDPQHQHDLVVFLGEEQPPMGKYPFCRKLLDHARELGVERVFTFAAMATQMHPEHRSRVFGAATDAVSLNELKRLELEILQDGHIGGLNGVLLGAAAEAGLRGSCLLGEMPHIFAQVPFPKASLAILEVFTTIAGTELDFTALAEQARAVDRQLGEALARVEQSLETSAPVEEEGHTPEPGEEVRLSPAAEERMEKLFVQARNDRAKAFELKQELDRLGVFKEYEDRFLDLFKQGGSG